MPQIDTNLTLKASNVPLAIMFSAAGTEASQSALRTKGCVKKASIPNQEQFARGTESTTRRLTDRVTWRFSFPALDEAEGLLRLV